MKYKKQIHADEKNPVEIALKMTIYWHFFAYVTFNHTFYPCLCLKMTYKNKRG